MFAATSLRKAVLNAAASSKVSGGTSRVLVFPGSEAFAITAMPQDGGFWVRMRVCPSPIAADLRERMTLPRRSVPRYAARTHQVTTTLTLRDHIPAGACATRVHATVIVKGDRRPPRRHRPPRNTLHRHRPASQHTPPVIARESGRSSTPRWHRRDLAPDTKRGVCWIARFRGQ